MPNTHIQNYYHLQHESFCVHVKAVVKALEKMLALKGDQVTEQQRAAVQGVKAIYSGQLIEDIKRDLASGNVTMETVENPDRANAMRTNLKNQLL